MSNREIYERMFIQKLKEHNDAQPKFSLTIKREAHLVPKEPIFGPKFSGILDVSLRRDFLGSEPTPDEGKATNLSSATKFAPISNNKLIKTLGRTIKTPTPIGKRVSKAISSGAQLTGTAAASQKFASTQKALNSFPGLIGPKNFSIQSHQHSTPEAQSSSGGTSDPSNTSSSNPKIAAQLIADWNKFKQIQATSSTNEPSLRLHEVHEQHAAAAVAKQTRDNKGEAKKGSSSRTRVDQNSLPNVSQAPKAVLGPASLPGSNKLKLPNQIHTSLAKTIAEQTPNGFKTLGPGFNKGREKSSSRDRNGLNQMPSMPSDYEHIFHAPSDISDGATPPGSDHSTHETSHRRHKSGKKK